jgi:hypothetical protein
MIDTPVLSLCVAILALCVSAILAYRAFRLSGAQVHLTNRAEFLKMMIALDKELISDQDLWAFFGGLPDEPPKPFIDQAKRGKTIAFGLSFVNSIELIYMYNHDHLKNPALRHDHEGWKSWDRQFRLVLGRSQIACTVILTAPLFDLFPLEFQKYVMQCKEDGDWYNIIPLYPDATPIILAFGISLIARNDKSPCPAEAEPGLFLKPTYLSVHCLRITSAPGIRPRSADESIPAVAFLDKSSGWGRNDKKPPNAEAPGGCFIVFRHASGLWPWLSCFAQPSRRSPYGSGGSRAAVRQGCRI